MVPKRASSVEMTLFNKKIYSCEGGTRGGRFARILETISADGEEHTVDFGFEGSDVGDKAAVG